MGAAPVRRRRPPKRSGRHPLPPERLWIEHRQEPESCTCGDRGRDLVPIGEDLSEQPGVEPARFFVHRHIRPQYACRHGGAGPARLGAGPVVPRPPAALPDRKDQRASGGADRPVEAGAVGRSAGRRPATSGRSAGLRAHAGTGAARRRNPGAATRPRQGQNATSFPGGLPQQRPGGGRRGSSSSTTRRAAAASMPVTSSTTGAAI